MIRSIINFVFRNFTRHFSFSIITLSSLVLGITTTLLMFLWVTYEVTYNDTLIDRDRVFALLMNYTASGEVDTEEGTSVPMVELLSHDVPEVEAITRINNSRVILANGEKSIQKTGVFGDSSFFKVHVPEHMAGNATHVLSNNRSIAVSEKLAIDLFGTDKVLGKTILVDRKVEYQITGVFSSYSDHSNLNYINFVLPYSARSKDDNWVNHDIKLIDAASRESVEKIIDKKLATLYPDEKATSLLFGMKDWRLHWAFKNGKSSGGRIVYVVIFSIASLFVLIMSCVNYMNIASARATKRTREIGVRKMTGATQTMLIRQFMTESLVMTSMAAAIAVILAKLLLPAFNQLVGIQLDFSLLDPLVIAGLASITLLTGLLAGSYPALVLSSFKPAAVLKSSLYTNTSGAGFRNGLVVFQFALSVVMIFCALVMWKQIDFLLKKELGYDKHRVINVWVDNGSDNLPLENTIAMIESHASIESAAFGGASPMEINGNSECNRVVAPLKTPLWFFGVNIDDRVLKTLKFKFVQGRNFSRDHASDSSNFIVTESAVKLLGFDNPIGQRISYNMYGKQEGEIVGVVKDFQNDDVHVAEKPVVFVYGKPKFLSNLFVRYHEGQLEQALLHVKKTFEKIQPGVEHDYSFLDVDFEVQLHRETLIKKISIVFTVVAVAIACLGLFGLVLFNAQRRTKEIGIRKVLGASEKQIVLLLCRHVIPFVCYSLLFAFPIGYYLMKNFLDGYPTRVVISPNLFLIVAGFITFMVLLTVSYQSIKAARQNAVESLKTE